MEENQQIDAALPVDLGMETGVVENISERPLAPMGQKGRTDADSGW